MPKNATQILLENEELRSRLAEAEEALSAIRNGEVDAIVVSGNLGQKIFSLSTADTPYRLLIENMEEGAVTLTDQGVILYSNPKFISMTGTPEEKITGRKIFSFIEKKDFSKFKVFLENAVKNERRIGEFRIAGSSNKEIFCRFAVSTLPSGMTGDLFLIVSDITALKEYERHIENEKKNTDKIVLNKTFEAVEKERKKIASDLHDDLGPTLSAIKLQLTMLPNAHSDEVLNSSNEMLDDCINRMRLLAGIISPNIVETYGLETGLLSFISKIEKTNKLQFGFTSNLKEKRFGKEIEMHLYRIVTELINNTIKHVGIANVILDLKMHDEGIQVLYSDNGPVYEFESKPTVASGTGLLNIKNRINIIDGKINFLKRDGHIVVVVNVEFPC